MPQVPLLRVAGQQKRGQRIHAEGLHGSHDVSILIHKACACPGFWIGFWIGQVISYRICRNQVTVML
jgi:hypothetical protein